MRTATWQGWRSRVGGVGFLSGLVFVAMAARGDGCVPEPDPGDQKECTQPADCDGLAHIDCVGAWSCEANTCAWNCQTEPPTGCYSDNECPAGYECNSETVCLPPPGCGHGQVCPAVCYGECVKKTPPPTCTSSNECPSGTHCSTEDGVCNGGCGGFRDNSGGGVPAGDAACAMVCTGECVDNATACFTDSECGQGQWCDRSECGAVPASDAAGARIACGGVCRDRDRCTSNSDCNAGEACACAPMNGTMATPGSAGAMMMCDLRCVPSPDPVECYSNAECPADTHCISDCAPVPADASGSSDAGASDRAAIYCPSHCQPDRACGNEGQVCGPNEICSAECRAEQTDCDCVGDQPCDCPFVEVCDAKCIPEDNSCNSNVDCDPGFYCGCGPFANANASDVPGGLMVCNLQCLPEQKTECRSDADCGGDAYCNFSGCTTDGDYAKRPCNADDPNCGMPAPPTCTGVCEPRPSMCSTNEDCGSGFECVIDVCAGAADPSGASSEYACWGHCQASQPKPYDCWSDTDCGAGGWCEYDYMNCTSSFAPDPQGEMPVPMPVCGGWCHYAEPIPCDPNTANACPAGTECQMVSGCGMTPVPASGMPCMMTYQCVPVVKPECNADCDCAFGLGCVNGACVPQEPVGPCDDAWTCKEGYTCGCPTRFGGPAAGIACFPQCYPDRPECCDDSQCGGGEICNGGACETVFCYDQKCPEGHHCESQCGGPMPAGGLVACPMVCVADAPACASDCDCDSSTACINGACQIADRMNQCYGGQCMVDSDCGPGSYCKVDYYTGCNKPDVPCAIMPVGYCVAEPTPIPCGPNQECPAGTVCTATNSPSCPQCDIAFMQCLPAPPPNGCVTNADCGDGGVCHTETTTCTCSVDSAGNVICPPCAAPNGWCEYPPKETLCDANGACPSGFQCNTCAHGSCPACDDCVAVCEPKVDLGCRGDADCATGERCDFKACTSAGACAPGSASCAAVCTGQCVPKEDTNPCFATGCSGQICANHDVVSTCEFLPWYACYKLASCEADAAGSCGWSQTPEFLKCMQEMGAF